MKHLDSFISQLNRACKDAGIENIPVTHVKEEKAFSQVESDGKTYHYPHLVHFNIDAWSTYKYSLRVSDGRFIKEATNLNSDGFTAEDVINRVVDNKKAQVERIRTRDAAKAKAESLGKAALETYHNEFIMVDPEVASFANSRGLKVFKCIREDGSSHGWTTFDAKEAINEELSHFRRNPSPIVDVLLTDKEVYLKEKT